MNSQSQNSVMRQVQNDEPVMVAWQAYQRTEAYANTLLWAGKNAEGSLWAAFCEGFKAAGGEIK